MKRYTSQYPEIALTEKSVKILGKKFDCKLRDTAAIQKTIKYLQTRLRSINLDYPVG